MAPKFDYNSYQKTTFQKRYDADGTVWIEAVAGATLTAKTPVKIIADEYGYITAALADDTKYYYVGVPEAAGTTGTAYWLQIGGYCADVITPSLSVSVGHAFKIYDGAIADVGADFSGAAGEFAVCTTVSTTSTTQDMMLIPEQILSTT